MERALFLFQEQKEIKADIAFTLHDFPAGKTSFDNTFAEPKSGPSSTPWAFDSNGRYGLYPIVHKWI